MADMLTEVVRALRQRPNLELNLELVLDSGGSGMLWSQLAAELCARLENQGAFRRAQFRMFDTDSPGHFGETERGSAITGSSMRGTMSSPQRGTLLMFLTDSTGQAWQTGEMYWWLRNWRIRGAVLIVQLLPVTMWNRTALQAVPVTSPLGDEERIKVTEDDLLAVGLDSSSLRTAQDIPVVELKAQSIRSWLPLLSGAKHGAVSGWALLVPAEAEERASGSEQNPQESPGELPSAEERVHRFDIIASEEARKLVRHLSESRLELAVMREIKQRLSPGSGPAGLTVLAEVLLGGLVYRTSPEVADTLEKEVTFEFHPGVRHLLQEQLASEAEPRSPSGTVPVARYTPAADAEIEESGQQATPDTRPLQITFWGSPSSGKTTFLTVLNLGWWPSRTGAEWRVEPLGKLTRHYMNILAREFNSAQQFPPSTVGSVQLSFKFVRRPPRRRLMRRAAPAAEIEVKLEEMPARVLHKNNPLEDALENLKRADAIVYFFDATRDAKAQSESHALDYFSAADARLRRWAAEDGTIVDGYLPHHVAVCISKLDDPFVFGVARRYGCLKADPADQATRRPWVPDRHARRLFEALCREQMTPQADTLLAQLRHSFHPDRISFHVLSSIGFWVGDNGRFDPEDFCNVRTDPADAEKLRLRGEIKPVHVVDPLVALIERVSKAGKK